LPTAHDEKRRPDKLRIDPTFSDQVRGFDTFLEAQIFFGTFHLPRLK
jgi:hypothetical protein